MTHIRLAGTRVRRASGFPARAIRWAAEQVVGGRLGSADFAPQRTCHQARVHLWDRAAAVDRLVAPYLASLTPHGGGSPSWHVEHPDAWTFLQLHAPLLWPCGPDREGSDLGGDGAGGGGLRSALAAADPPLGRRRLSLLLGGLGASCYPGWDHLSLTPQSKPLVFNPAVSGDRVLSGVRLRFARWPPGGGVVRASGELSAVLALNWHHVWHPPMSCDPVLPVLHLIRQLWLGRLRAQLASAGGGGGEAARVLAAHLADADGVRALDTAGLLAAVAQHGSREARDLVLHAIVDAHGPALGAAGPGLVPVAGRGGVEGPGPASFLWAEPPAGGSALPTPLHAVGAVALWALCGQLIRAPAAGSVGTAPLPGPDAPVPLAAAPPDLDGPEWPHLRGEAEWQHWMRWTLGALVARTRPARTARYRALRAAAAALNAAPEAASNAAPHGVQECAGALDWASGPDARPNVLAPLFPHHAVSPSHAHFLFAAPFSGASEAAGADPGSGRVLTTTASAIDPAASPESERTVAGALALLALARARSRPRGGAGRVGASAGLSAQQQRATADTVSVLPTIVLAGASALATVDPLHYGQPQAPLSSLGSGGGPVCAGLGIVPRTPSTLEVLLAAADIRDVVRGEFGAAASASAAAAPGGGGEGEHPVPRSPQPLAEDAWARLSGAMLGPAVIWTRQRTAVGSDLRKIFWVRLVLGAAGAARCLAGAFHDPVLGRICIRPRGRPPHRTPRIHRAQPLSWPDIVAAMDRGTLSARTGPPLQPRQHLLFTGRGWLGTVWGTAPRPLARAQRSPSAVAKEPSPTVVVPTTWSDPARPVTGAWRRGGAGLGRRWLGPGPPDPAGGSATTGGPPGLPSNTGR